MLSVTVTCDTCHGSEEITLWDSNHITEDDLPYGWEASEDGEEHTCEECLEGVEEQDTPFLRHQLSTVVSWKELHRVVNGFRGVSQYHLQCECGMSYPDRTIAPQFNCVRCSRPVIGEINTLVRVQQEAK